ncbi:UvrD-helicase domain-containing protein [Paraconexibacter antarcticus]|uniref:DNA 3'-5' helicase n=1 Tax=Paraconexibacter antarcticus TaxID=2949664 RepID=A0ABY5DM08_9ACTN|nr:UvrD-helicase domain-containing protein [Paraconexibacter antarcticus]UTI62963.1 UvrD-helicase domain-containing protein [Paraconexibacter antarcticus]
MPDAAPASHLETLLEGLNDPQRQAVVHGEGPLLVLAGAGSGKTRVLTHRIAYLIGTQQARPGEILAITFTNKAAQEMRERVGLLLGHSVRSMWVMTFHAACVRILRSEAPRLGYTRQFTIYDTADSKRLVKRCLDELDLDSKRFTPAAVLHQISDAKNKLRDPDAYKQLTGGYYEQTIGEVYTLYQSQLHAMNAMDFDDLLNNVVAVLELFPEVRARYQATFRHILVDEYQDTNHAQYRLLQLLAGDAPDSPQNLMVVGDDGQCLAEGTLVTMADGTRRPIEAVAVGDHVQSCHGEGVFGPATVLRTSASRRRDGVAITLASGRCVVSTPEHTHFAGFARGTADAEAARASIIHPGEGGRSTPGAGTMVRVVDAVRGRTHGVVRHLARLGAGADGVLPFLPARDVRPGMVMFAEDGALDAVTSVGTVVLDAPVYDIDVEHTHNFVAGGIVTHNSVYSFRGADISNILNFQDDYPSATQVKLEQNYRSNQTILSAANAIIGHNRSQIPKTLWTDQGDGDPIVVRELDDEHAEARYVVGEIERLVDEGVSRAEIAIFYRTNAQSRVIEDTLVRREIAYQVIGGTKFYERAEIKDAIAYLTILGNGQDVVSFTRVANSPRRGIGQTSLSRVISHAATMGIPVWEAAEDPMGVPGLGTAAVKALGRFMDTMNGLRARMDDGIPVGDLLEAVLSETGYLEALEAERTIEAQGRTENLQELVEVAREFDHATAQDPELEDTVDVFLQQVSLVADADTRQDDEGMVTLMTLHNAKGLEYPIVYLIGCEEGVFPHSRSIEEGTLEEERRLMYVGITRAMRSLTLTHARRRAVFGGAPNYGLPSRFLAELPPDLVDRQGTASGWGAASVASGAPRPRAISSWSGGAIGSASGSGSRSGQTWGNESGATPSFRMGDDVVHAAFGDGVVTGVESGGVVVVRFASDGSERKLMADYAPITKR